MIPELFSIPFPFFGTLPIYTFGFMMLCCFLGAMKLLEKLLASLNMEEVIAEQLITWAAIGGILGARLLSILSYPSALMADPIGVIFSGSGFVFYGGFLGGALAVYLVLKRNSLSPISMGDVIAAPLAFGYAIGRIGCQLSGDGDYGSPSSLPWAMNYLYGVVPTADIVHPAPVYETFAALLLTFLLLSPKTRAFFKFRGQLFGVYLAISAIFRFLVEFLRIEPIVWQGLTQAQVFALILFITGVLFIFLPGRREKNLFLEKEIRT